MANDQLDMVIWEPGGPNKVEGDYLYRDFLSTDFATGAWGLFRSLGTLGLHSAVVTRQSHAAGASNGMADGAALVLEGVVRVDNTDDAILRDVDLVEIDLPPPPAPCLAPPCP